MQRTEPLTPTSEMSHGQWQTLHLQNSHREVSDVQQCITTSYHVTTRLLSPSHLCYDIGMMSLLYSSQLSLPPLLHMYYDIIMTSSWHDGLLRIALPPIYWNSPEYHGLLQECIAGLKLPAPDRLSPTEGCDWFTQCAQCLQYVGQIHSGDDQTSLVPLLSRWPCDWIS